VRWRGDGRRLRERVRWARRGEPWNWSLSPRAVQAAEFGCFPSALALALAQNSCIIKLLL
jgi:hypothetical protein